MRHQCCDGERGASNTRTVAWIDEATRAWDTSGSVFGWRCKGAATVEAPCVLRHYLLCRSHPRTRVAARGTVDHCQTCPEGFPYTAGHDNAISSRLPRHTTSQHRCSRTREKGRWHWVSPPTAAHSPNQDEAWQQPQEQRRSSLGF